MPRTALFFRRVPTSAVSFLFEMQNAVSSKKWKSLRLVSAMLLCLQYTAFSLCTLYTQNRRVSLL